MARSFNGTSDVISIGTSTTLDFADPTPFTVAVWAYAATVTSGNLMSVFEKGYDGAFEQWFLRFNDGPPLTLQFGGFGSGQATLTSSTVTTGTWYHVAGTYVPTSGGNGNWALYVNGISVATATNTQGPEHSAEPPAIGAAIFSGAPQRFLNGRAADAAGWNVVLSAGEIAALANGARPNTIRPTALQGWWPLDGLQSPEPDLSGKATNGTVTGTALAPGGPPVMQFTPRWPQVLAPPASAGSVGTANGIGAASAVSAATKTSVGTANGIGAAAGVGASTAKAAGTANGIGAAAATAGTAGSVGTANGVGAAAGVGKSTAAAAGTAAGVAAASGVGASTAKAAGTAAAVGAAAGVGLGVKVATGTANGVGAAAAVGKSTAAATGTAAGIGGAAATAAGTSPASGIANGVCTASGRGAFIIAKQIPINKISVLLSSFSGKSVLTDNDGSSSVGPA